ncbi:hypothetical protein JW926_18460 [Candidatus Sumerlaeota bacterium]|nr:hypothetical protein [Candidatus Sumerlaeota bacterium]
MSVIINNIHPALRILSSENKSLLIAHTEEGAKLAYLPNIAPEKIHFNELKPGGKENNLVFPRNSEQLIQNLYQESLDFLKGPFSQSGQSPHIFINADLPHIKEQLTRILKERKNKDSFFWNFQLKATPENIDLIANLIKDISTINKSERPTFNLHLLFPYYERWQDNLCYHLEDMLSHEFLTISLYITESAVLGEQQKLIQWLDMFQDSGFSLPVFFDSPKIMLSQQGKHIIEAIIQNGLAKYVAIDLFGLTRLKTQRQRKGYMKYYSLLISSWIQKEDYPIWGLRDFIYLFSKIMEPLSHRIVFLGKNLSFDDGCEWGREKLLSIWKEISSHSELLGDIFPSLLPFHLYEDSSGRIKTIPTDIVYDYGCIYEHCIRFIVRVILKECEEAITANRPLSLDLNLEKPVYHSKGWNKARSVLYNIGNKNKE